MGQHLREKAGRRPKLIGGVSCKVSLKDEVLGYIQKIPGKSASQIAKDLGKNPGSVSALLNKLVKDGVLVRTEGEGPKGGFGYHIPKKVPSSKRTSWQRLLDEDF